MIKGSKAILGIEKATVGLKSTPDVPQQPGVPQLDTAKQNLNEYDRIRRRRGVLANIFAGSSTEAAPTVGVKTLLGD